MPGSRTFASGDSLSMNIGSALVTDPYTLAAVILPASASANQVWLMDAGTLFQFGVDATNVFGWDGVHEPISSLVIPTASAWNTMVETKGAGTVAPRMMRGVMLSGAVTYDTPAIALAPSTAALRWHFGFATGYPFIGQCACWAIWKRVMADAEMASLMTFSGFLNAAPDMLVPMDREPPFVDLGSGSGTQNTLTGTTHSALEPPGFWDRPSVPHGMGRVLI